MKLRWKSLLIPLPLITAMLIGVYFDFKASAERTRLQNDYRRLVRIAGAMEVDDSSKVFVVAIETDEPLHWMWRIHTPAKFTVNVRHDSGSSSGWNSEPRDFTIHVRFKKSDDGQLDEYVSHGGGSSRSSIGEKEYADWLFANAKELVVEQAGKGKAVAFDADKEIPMLKVTLPESLMNDPIAKQKRQPGPDVFRLIINETAKPK